MKNVVYEWQPEEGLAICKVYYNNIEFKGTASCHPDDIDMCSKMTGQTIAELRAEIKKLQHIRDNELRPQLKVLNQLYYAMNRSKEYNKKSYESKMLYRAIKNISNELDMIKEMLDSDRKFLKDYIGLKDIYYKNIRSRREAKAD
jgi:hypothetical protein